MSEQMGGPSNLPLFPQAQPRLSLGRRIRDMILLWVVLGAVTGAASAPVGSGPGGIVFGIIGGILVLPWLGAVLGLIGARCPETIFGAVCGATIGTVGGVFSGPAVLCNPAGLCLILGGLVGATFPQVYHTYGWLVRWVAARF
jgi:hypothetical protein